MCDICKTNRRNAIKVNQINICHDCLRFFERSAINNKKTWFEEIKYQTNYINRITLKFVDKK